MKRVLAVVTLLCVIVGVLWAIYSSVMKDRREAAYSSALQSFQRDLRLGESSAEVSAYLKSRNTAYHVVRIGGREGPTYQVKVGEDPGSLVCEPWQVYVAMEFDSSDRLTAVHLSRMGTCL